MAPVEDLPRVLAEATLRDVERNLGFPLPAQLSQLYGEVANGGFGPGYGLVGVREGRRGFMRFDGSRHIEEEYAAQLRSEDEGFRWPERIIPICDWGCAIYSCIDCNESDAPVLRFFGDAAADQIGPSPFTKEAPSLHAWLSDWVSGVSLWEQGMTDDFWLPTS